MAVQSENMKQSSASSSDDRPSPEEAGPVGDFAPDVLWFAASLLLALAGSWGMIGGWYFGLPGGGEIRQNVLSDQSLTFRDLFVAIPHPDFAELPFVPKSGGG